MSEDLNKPGEHGTPPPVQPVSSTENTSSGYIIEAPAKAPIPEKVLHEIVVKEKDKKKFSEYAKEFALVLTAVILGFTADYFREYLEDKSREKKYIQSLQSDLNTDYALSVNVGDTIAYQVRQLDSLEALLIFGDLRSKEIIVKCYDLSSSILTFYPEFYNERTINQLLSSGSMRLINDQNVADSIMAYHSYIKFAEVQRQLYINAANDCSKLMYDVYDIAFLRSGFNEDGILTPVTIDSANAEFRTSNREELRNFIAALENFKLIANNYIGILESMEKKAVSLYKFLRNEYGID